MAAEHSHPETPPPAPAAPLSASPAPRILIIDDTPAIHLDFRKILEKDDASPLDGPAAELFGDAPEPSRRSGFLLDSAYQGEEAVGLVSRALAEGRPYAFAMVDVRMPPGWDGIETTAHLWVADPNLQVVICTAYSDYSWEEMIARLGETDSLVILKKPFEAVEVLQLAHALTKKWELTRQSRSRLADLDAMVNERTVELRAANETLSGEIAERLRAQQTLQHRLRMENLVSTVSSSFIMLSPGKADAAIEQALRATGTAMGADRAALLCLTPDSLAFENTHEWFAGSGSGPSPPKQVALSSFPFWGRKLAQWEILRVPKVDDLPADAVAEKEYMRTLGIQSTLAVPLTSGKSALGYFAISYQAGGKAWAEEDEAMLKTVGEILAGALRHVQAEQRLLLQSAALESAADAIVITNPQGEVLWHNPAFERLTGYAEAEVVGKKTSLLKSGKQRPEVYRDLWQTVSAGRVWRGELVNRRKDESLYTEQMTITPVRGDAGAITHYIAIKQDVTARKQLEAQLRQSQKMEAIGLLAGGVAHDFNNLLAVIRGNIELVLMGQTDFSADTRESLNEIATAADRAADLTRQLLAFGRKQTMLARPIDLNVVVANLTKMLKRVIGEDVHLECRYAPQPLFVRADIGTVEQVLTNLIVNARDAMPSGGNLRIATEPILFKEVDLRPDLERRPGEFICLSVADTGTGIAAEHLPRVFEPFFTTKGPGKGTGLGLATVYGIIEQHLGWIEVSSQMGVGSTFRVLLPACAPPVAEPATLEQKKKLPGGRERILLVEDEESLRAVTRRVLERFGYQVQEAASGRAALEAWRDRTGEVDLLLTDIVMPLGVNGRQLAAQLRQQRPTLKVILMSGYSGNALEQQAPQGDNQPLRVLQKPFASNDLILTVRQVLDEN